MSRILYLIATVGFVTAVAAPAGAQLALPGSFYFGPEGGWTHLETVSNKGHPDDIGPFVGRNSESLESFKDGFNVGGRAGFQMGPWRLEGELSYRRNDTQNLQMILPINRPGMAGNAERHSLAEMANVIYDMDLGLPLTPHVGGGIGAAEVTRNLSNRFGGTHDTVTVFAYQAIGGLRYMVLPSLAFDIDYRYFATAGTTFTSTNPDEIRSSYPTHNVVASLTWLFAAPSPPPAPPPQPVAYPPPPPPSPVVPRVRG
jgi:OOP family OmpA-OmpF porin